MGRLSTRQEARTALGLPSVRALDKLVEKGAPPPRPGRPGSKRYDVPAIKAWIADRKAKATPAIDLALARARLADVQTRLATLKLREAEGELIKAADVEHVQRSIAAAVKSQLLAVPRRAVLAGLPRAHEALVKQLIGEALRELSEVKTVAVLEREGAA